MTVDDVMRLWDQKLDTWEIARKLQTSEALVASLLHQGMARRRAAYRETSDGVA